MPTAPSNSWTFCIQTDAAAGSVTIPAGRTPRAGALGWFVPPFQGNTQLSGVLQRNYRGAESETSGGETSYPL